VLAADSRGTFGDPRGVTAQNDTMIKAYVIGGSGVLLAGSGEFGSLLLTDFSKERAGATGAVEDLVTNLVEFARDWSGRLFPNIAPVVPPILAQSGQAVSRPEIELLIGGYSEGGDPMIYHLASSYDWAPMLHNYGFAVAGVPQYALYLLNRLYDPARSMADLSALATYVITETASQDGKVGGPIRAIQVTKDGAGELDSQEIHRIVELNETRQQALKDSFYSEVGDQDDN